MQGQIELGKIRKSGFLTFYQFFKFFDFWVQSEAKKETILVKFSLRKVRLNPREVILHELLSNQCYCLLIDFCEYFLGLKKMEGRWDILLHNSI